MTKFRAGYQGTYTTNTMEEVTMEYTGIKRSTIRKALAAFFIMSSILVGIMVLGNQPTLEENIEWVTVRAYDGDTLWDMVAEHNHTDKVELGDLVELAQYDDVNRDIHVSQGTFTLKAGRTVRIPVYKK